MQKFSELEIVFNTGFKLQFTLHDTIITRRWANVLNEALNSPYEIDDPERFYGFNAPKLEQQNALNQINTTIDIINTHAPIIERHMSSIDDQDTLNYLHNIFEIYHGLLDQQTHEFFLSAPEHVQKALAKLNIDVHRCESSYRSIHPRMVLTWFGLPKTKQFAPDDFLEITNRYQFGTVYLNYVEIGKTLEDLYMDNDQYISDGAFQPLNHFSADFTIKFIDTDYEEAEQNRIAIMEYAKQHEKFFNHLGYDINSPQLQPGLIPVAEISTTLSDSDILRNIQLSQHVNSVILT